MLNHVARSPIDFVLLHASAGAVTGRGCAVADEREVHLDQHLQREHLHRRSRHWRQCVALVAPVALVTPSPLSPRHPVTHTPLLAAMLPLISLPHHPPTCPLAHDPSSTHSAMRLSLSASNCAVLWCAPSHVIGRQGHKSRVLPSPFNRPSNHSLASLLRCTHGRGCIACL
jgi:hypothetical protein